MNPQHQEAQDAAQTMTDAIKLPELLPCPFCGGSAELIAGGRSWWKIAVQHDDDCIFEADHEQIVPKTEVQKQLLVKDWNRRAAIQADRAGRGEVVAWMHVQGNHQEPSTRELDEFEISRGWTQFPLYANPPPQAERVPLSDEQCEWAIQDDGYGGDTWQSSCGELWSFIDGGPKENRVSFCHHCGKKVGIGTPKEST